jgi:hypothetical protein
MSLCHRVTIGLFVLCMCIGQVFAGASARTWYVRTVPPVTDPTNPEWGMQASGGDGTQESPYGSVAELFEHETLLADDVIEIDSLSSGVPNYGAITIEKVPGVRIRSWNIGSGKSRLICGKPIDLDIPHLLGGSYDVYRTQSGALPELPNRVSQNWNVNVNAIGQRYGILDGKESPQACAEDYGFYFDDATGTLYVSIPPGENISTYEHIVGDPGHGLMIFDCPDAVVENLIVEHAFSENSTEGYGIRFDGNSPRCQALNNVTDGCRWHSIGTVAHDPRGTKIRGNHCRTTIPTNDSHIVIFAAEKGGQVSECEITDNLIELDPWLGWDAQPFHPTGGGVIAIACHTDGRATQSPAGGLIIARNRTVWSGYYPSYRHTDVVLVGSHTNLGGRPKDIHDHASYPIQLNDNVWGGHGMTVGGGWASYVWASSQGDHWNLDAAGVTESLGTPGLLGCIEGTFSDNGLRIASSTLSGQTRTDELSKSLVAVGTGASLILDGVSVYLRGTGYTPATRLIAFSPQAELFHASGSIFAAEQDGIRLSTGSWVGAMPDAQAEADAWEHNWYAPNLHTTFNSSVGRRRADFQSDLDPQAEYSALPGFLDAVLLEPDEQTRSVKNLPRITGLRGVNDKPYDQTYGAWQFGEDCLADLNHDGSLDFFDVSLFLKAYGSSDLSVDFNHDGLLNFFDVSAFLDRFSTGCP